MEIKVDLINEIHVMRVTGKLDNSNAYDCEVKISELIDSGCRNLIFDFSRLEYISSAGLRIILVAIRMLRDKSGKLSIFGMSDHVTEVFAICGLNSKINTYKTQDEAVNA